MNDWADKLWMWEPPLRERGFCERVMLRIWDGMEDRTTMNRFALIALILVALLFAANVSANTIQLRHEVLTRLQSANLVMQTGATGGCAIWDYADVVIVACYGDDRRRQYKQVMVALADLNPVNKYSALLNSGHVEVR